MSVVSGLLELSVQGAHPSGHRVFGVAIAQVVTNLDSTGLGRVQVRFPWLPGIEPWARVATPMAGHSRGAWFMPQPDEEVLVAFHQGDVREPYVIGSLWNGLDRPPATAPTDAVGKRMLRTPLGHEIVIDDQAQSMTITTVTKQKVAISPEKIEVSTTEGTATLTLTTAGTITLKAKVSLALEAPTITVRGEAVDIKGTATAGLKGDATCTIQGGVVKIN